ncbi:MAG: DUF1016 N-terminal domain-containing protein [Candidatus Omnitrophica bacterium]|nr:DUF1016 N-terminal domain-containing protein [Candidatus Omnitrophota bacterium]
MTDSKLVPLTYKRLISDIVCRYEGVRRSLVEAGWKTGRDIVLVDQKGKIRATRGERLLQKISEDLTKQLGSGFSVQNLRRMRQFYLDNLKRSPASVLTWAHHIELLSIRDEKKRLALEKRAEQDELDRDSLRALVRHELVRAEVAQNLAVPAEDREQPELLKVPELGTLNTYQIKDPNDTAWPDKKVLLLDHGFKGYRALTFRESRGLKAGDIVEWTGTKLLETRRSAKDLYIYKAYLETVIDGDTFWVALDIGAREVSRQKLRLRGIDCPEIDTQEGQAAKKFVETVLKDVSHLIVLSSKNASYDRYEADVFFRDKTGREVYLNNLLLEKGFAVRVRE